MILTLFVALSALGFITWILGSIFQMRAVAAIGGVLLVGVGVMVIGTGLEYRSGQFRDHDVSVMEVDGNNTTVTNSTEIAYQYQEADLPQQYSLGFLIVLLGSLALFRALEPE